MIPDPDFADFLVTFLVGYTAGVGTTASLILIFEPELRSLLYRIVRFLVARTTQRLTTPHS